jgi:tetratricopeptide (TPR) repeat protein
MDEQRTFVGRQAELKRFLEILEDPQGQAIVVVGQAGMGKTWLVDRMTYLAARHPDLRCGYVRYEVTPTDSPDSTMALIMDHAFEAANQKDGFFELTDRSRSQWAALFKTFVPKGSDILELRDSLRRDPQQHTRQQFLDRLGLISKRMGPDGRALFVIDPEKYMCKGCSDSWRLVTRDLPDRIKFLFAQRDEDELITSNAFMALGNVVRLPEAPLGILAPEEVEELVRLRADEVGQSGKILRDAMVQYEGHPYAVQAAMEIVKRTKRVDDLPQDPTNEGIAATQWNQVCRIGENAIRLFEAYAILEVAVARDVAQAVSGLDALSVKRLLNDSYLHGLLRDEGQGQRIYHAILGDHVRGQIDPTEQKNLHTKAILVYRISLKEAREQQRAPKALAAVRLSEHVLAAEGPDAFIATFVNECTPPLLTLGLLDVALSLSRRSLELVEKDTNEEATILGNQAVILHDRGDLDGAMALQKEKERICRQLGNLEGLQASLGNQAVILHDRGDLDGAMALLKEQERICCQLGNLDNLQRTLGNEAEVLYACGDQDRAMALLKEKERICRQLGCLDGLSSSLGNQGVILHDRGDLDGAMVLHKDEEQICRQLSHLEGLAISLANQAFVLRQMGRVHKALPLAEEAWQLASKHGYVMLARQIKPILEGVRRAMGETPDKT